MIARSVQLSQPPQAIGTAARTARNGSRMNAPSASCSLRDWTSPPSVAFRSTRSSSSAGADVVMWGPHVCTARTYETVTYVLVAFQDRAVPHHRSPYAFGGQ